VPEKGDRKLRRALTAEERGSLEARQAALEPWVVGYHESEVDEVALALTDMFGGFPSMRQNGEEAAARTDSIRRILTSFPEWAITKVCTSIQTNGVWRDGKFDRQWAPSDSEIVAAVRAEVRLYADQHRSAVALLSAEVEA
jgi:hypothetical protein